MAPYLALLPGHLSLSHRQSHARTGLLRSRRALIGGREGVCPSCRTSLAQLLLARPLLWRPRRCVQRDTPVLGPFPTPPPEVGLVIDRSGRSASPPTPHAPRLLSGTLRLLSVPAPGVTPCTAAQASATTAMPMPWSAHEPVAGIVPHRARPQRSPQGPRGSHRVFILLGGSS
jgi:hypothetical protein